MLLAAAGTLTAHALFASFATAQQPLPPLIGVPPVAVMLANDDRFTTLVNAVNDTGLLSNFTSDDDAVTVFAPTNDAFAAAQDVIDSLSPEQLESVLTYHIAEGGLTFFEMEPRSPP